MRGSFLDVVFCFCLNNAEEEKLVAATDKSVVVVRPKFYIGSSGSVWASDYVRVRYHRKNGFEVWE